VRGAIVKHKSFSAVQERYLPENLPFHYSPIAIRYSPLAAVLMRRKFSAVRERCPPENSLLATRRLSTFTICR
jgi:hypothetical protein